MATETTTAAAVKEEEEQKKRVVCVTGANGFIGSWLVRTLLEQKGDGNGGYSSVHATIFPGSDASHLIALSSSNSSSSAKEGKRKPPIIEIFEADILDAGALSKAIHGCDGVFHVASPCTLDDPKDPEKELVIPAVQGTLNVLEASRKSGVKRVVLTSSISAIVPNPSWDNTSPFDETSWTDLDYCKSRQIGIRELLLGDWYKGALTRGSYTDIPNICHAVDGGPTGRLQVSYCSVWNEIFVQQKWYPVSKTLAEKAAWEYAEKYGMDVVAIHPSTCLGPLLQPSLNASCAVLQHLLQGSQDTQEYHWLGAVHVRDVANAQVLLFETPSASGRYLCTNGIYQFKDFAEIVSKLCPEFPVHRFTEETQPGLMGSKNAAKKLLNLGLVFTPIEDAIRETMESLKVKGFLRQEN